MDEQFKKQIFQALKHCGWTLVYTLFIMPWDIWVMATNRLAKYHMSDSLSLKSYDSPWPYLSMLKHLILEVGIDFSVFASYFAGVIAAAILFVTLNIPQGLLVLIATYYAPAILVIYRDLLQLMLLPVRKLLNFYSKPAQQLDITIVNENEVKE